MLVKEKRDRRVVFAARNRQHSLVVSIFTEMSIILPQTQKHREAELVQEKAQKIINSILRYVGYFEKAGALIALGEAITHTQHLEEARGAWKEAESLIEKIKDAGWRMERLSQLATALVEAREWERSEAILGLICVNFGIPWAESVQLCERGRTHPFHEEKPCFGFVSASRET
jgi:hypothetical protein